MPAVFVVALTSSGRSSAVTEPAAVLTAPVLESAPPPPSFDPASLQLPPADSKTAEAARALEEKRGADALRLLPAGPDTSALLRGRALLLVNRPAEAVEAFKSQTGLLAPKAMCHAAEALASLERTAEALEAWRSCGADVVKAGSAGVGEAKALLALGRRDEALAVLEPLVSSPSRVRADALATQARVYESIGRNSAALEAWRTLYVEEPSSALAASARSEAARLVKALKAEPIAPERLLERAERLVKARLMVDAANELKNVKTPGVCAPGKPCFERCRPEGSLSETVPRELKKPAAFTLAALESAPLPEVESELPSCAVTKIESPAPALDCRADLLRGWVAQRTRKYSAALPLLRGVYARCEEPEARALALYLASEAATRQKDPDSDDLARILSRQFPESSFGDDALLAAAERRRDRADPLNERRLLTEIIEKHRDGDKRSEALFRYFWSYRAEGRPDLGLNALSLLATQYEAASDGGDSERGRYWWGRTVAELAGESERERGIRELGLLARDRPLTYYGLLARSWLNEHGRKDEAVPVSGPAHSGPLLLGALSGQGAVELASALLSLGLKADAREALASIPRSLLPAGAQSSLIVSELYALADDPRMAHAVARRDLLGLMRDVSDPLARRAALVAYPLAFRAPIVEWSVQHGFDPNFMQGLMREESALDPRARSPVGARGLTQVMPATARQVAQTLGIKAFHVDQLWEPGTNIRIGSWYLGKMLEKYGHPGLAAASYNAGPGNLSRWLSRGMPDSFDAFVEEIPFDETRGYVKRVMRSYAAYGYLYDEGPGRVLMVNTGVVAARKLPTGGVSY